MKEAIIILSVFLLSFLKSYAQTTVITHPLDLWVPTNGTSDNSQDVSGYSLKVNIAGIVNNGTIEKKMMLDSKGLSLDNKYSSIYRISSFKMFVIVKGGSKSKEFENNENGAFTEDVLDAIKSAPIGSKVCFEYIQCVDKNKEKDTRRLEAAAFILQ